MAGMNRERASAGAGAHTPGAPLGTRRPLNRHAPGPQLQAAGAQPGGTIDRDAKRRFWRARNDADRAALMHAGMILNETCKAAKLVLQSDIARAAAGHSRPYSSWLEDVQRASDELFYFQDYEPPRAPRPGGPMDFQTRNAWRLCASLRLFAEWVQNCAPADRAESLGVAQAVAKASQLRDLTKWAAHVPASAEVERRLNVWDAERTGRGKPPTISRKCVSVVDVGGITDVFNEAVLAVRSALAAGGKTAAGAGQDNAIMSRVREWRYPPLDDASATTELHAAMLELNNLVRGARRQVTDCARAFNPTAQRSRDTTCHPEDVCMADATFRYSLSEFLGLLQAQEGGGGKLLFFFSPDGIADGHPDVRRLCLGIRQFADAVMAEVQRDPDTHEAARALFTATNWSGHASTVGRSSRDTPEYVDAAFLRGRVSLSLEALCARFKELAELWQQRASLWKAYRCSKPRARPDLAALYACGKAAECMYPACLKCWRNECARKWYEAAALPDGTGPTEAVKALRYMWSDGRAWGDESGDTRRRWKDRLAAAEARDAAAGAAGSDPARAAAVTAAGRAESDGGPSDAATATAPPAAGGAGAAAPRAAGGAGRP
jgi:hypothetical protein